MTDLENLIEDLAELREDVDYLTSIIDPAAATTPPSGSATSAQPPLERPAEASASRTGLAHVWHTLSPSEAEFSRAALTKWVDWLTARYTLDDTIPTCWYRHGAMVDELDALRAAWSAAYLDPHARLLDATYWLESLDRAITRLRGWDRYGCAAGTHQSDTASSSPTINDARAEYLQADVDARAPMPLYAVATDPSDG